MAKIFGGSKSKSQQTSKNESGNLAYQPIQNSFLPGASTAFQAGTQALQQELSGGFDGYRQKSGFDFFEKLGLRKVAGSKSGRGIFGSGATLKRLAEYQDGISRASYNDYLSQQSNLANLGIQGGGLVSNAGQYSKGESQGTSVSKQYDGMGKFIGQIIGSAAASDIRLKENITRVGDYGDIGMYQYDYIDGRGPFIGVMAHEVAERYPDALGPERAGYMTVDYSKLEEIING